MLFLKKYFLILFLSGFFFLFFVFFCLFGFCFLFFATLSLRGSMRAFSGSSERGHLSSWGARASHCSCFSNFRARALRVRALVVVVHGLLQLWLTGLDASQRVGSSQIRDWTISPRNDRWILHWTTREALKGALLINLKNHRGWKNFELLFSVEQFSVKLQIYSI